MSKINTQGLYDIPIEVYHGDTCEGHSVSGSGLVRIEQKTLAHYWYHSALNPTRPDTDTGALKFGRAAHAWILGEPEFARYFIVSPYEDFRTKEARAWRDAQVKTIIKSDQLAMIRAMGETILKTDLVRNAFTDGRAEQSLIWKDKETGIWLKSRPDWLPNSLPMVPNYKTARNGRPDEWAYDAFRRYGYHQGAALCLEGLKQVLGWSSPSYYFVVQEKEPPYIATLVLMKDTDIEWGALQNRSALRKLARAIDSGKFPGYADGAVEIDMPASMEHGLQARCEAGELVATDHREAA